MPKTLPLVVCIRNALLREGIVQLLRSGNQIVRGAISSVDHLCTIRINRDKRFIILLWITDLGDFDPDIIAQFRLSFPKVVIVVLLDRCQSENVWKLESMGASGVLLQSISHEVLIDSLRLVAMGDHVSNVPVGDDIIMDRGALDLPRRPPLLSSPKRFGSDARDAGPGRVDGQLGPAEPEHRNALSERERKILACLITGHSTDVIARAHRMSEAEVDVHLGRILQKIKAENQAKAEAWVVSSGELSGRLNGASGDEHGAGSFKKGSSEDC